MQLLPFIGFAYRFVNADGYCLASKKDAIDDVLNDQPVLLIEVFELSWLGFYWWLWHDDVSLLVAAVAEVE